MPSRSLALHCVTDDDDAAVRARHRALDQQQIALEVGLHHLEVERRDLFVAHVAGHLQALEHPAGIAGRADRTGSTVMLVVTVARALALEVVPLHATCKA